MKEFPELISISRLPPKDRLRKIRPDLKVLFDLNSEPGSWEMPAGALPPREAEGVKPNPMSLEELLTWEPTFLQRGLYRLPEFYTVDPTPHALSLSGTKEEQGQIYQGVLNFLSDPAVSDYLAETFHVSAKKFRGRPPLKIIADGKDSVTGIQDRYLGYIFKSTTTSLYFVLENEHHPLASIGFNQFSDGVEIRSVQGVRTDFDRLGNGLEKLVGLVEKYAEYQGLQYTMILPPSEHTWVNPRSFPLERAQKIYDETANNRHYTYNRKLKRFIKSA